MFQHQSCHQDAAAHKAQLRAFLTGLEQSPPPLLDGYVEQVDRNVWAETDCLACANCCRTMSPVFTTQDLKRIATHFRISVRAFKEKWLYKNNAGAWMNRMQPCQFLNLETNRCSIYAIRPEDCAGFPHLTKKSFVDYMHVHKQNIQYCPATLKMAEKLTALLNGL
jgi:Fe-S-cluster containining protein